MFYLYRPAIYDGDEGDLLHIRGGRGWDRELWWYKLAHVCQRWRNLLLGSASYLDLCLVCTYGTPVADMLAHSPPLPLIIDYSGVDWDIDITTEDEEEIILALEQRGRVRRIRLEVPLSNLQKLIMAIKDEYPVLEYLIVERLTEDMSTTLMLPETLQAPRLRHLGLEGFALPIGSGFLTTAVGLVTLVLVLRHPSSYFQPNTLLQWLSIMPHLETLQILFLFPVPNRDVERQLMQTPIMPHVTLPNLRWLAFQGVSAYMEAIVRRITTPRLERFGIYFFEQLTFSVPRLVQFINAAENLRFDSLKFQFSNHRVYVKVYSREEAEMYALQMVIFCLHFDWQVSSVAQVFNSLTRISSTVEHLTLEHLTLEHEVHSQSSEEHNEIDYTEWRKLLRSFSKVKTLRANNGLLLRSLRMDDGELSLELLPELQELSYSGSGDTIDELKSFIDSRQNAGRPVTLVYPRPRSETPLSRSSSSSFSSESPAITLGSSGAWSDVDT